MELIFAVVVSGFKFLRTTKYEELLCESLCEFWFGIYVCCGDYEDDDEEENDYVIYNEG